MSRQKPEVFKAISAAILGLAIFSLAYLLSYLIVSGVIYVLSLIPVINSLVDWLFHFRGDTPDMMLSLLCPILAYFCTMITQESINKNKCTRGLSCVLLGIFIIALHIMSVVVNLLSGEGILKNIIQAIAGLVIFKSGKDDLREAREEPQ